MTEEDKQKLNELFTKVWDMAQANMKQGNPPVVRQATYEWFYREFEKLIDKE